jgi:hypothetical protein
VVADKFTLAGGIGVPDGNIDHTDVVWAHRSLILPLNRTLLAAAQRNGWKPVVGITDEFKKHGYCANDHWIVRYDESKNRQINEDGTMHPNVAGHIAMARHIAASILEDTTLPRSRLAALAPPGSSNVYVFGRTASDTIQTNVYTGSFWPGWTSLGGWVSSAPVAVEPRPLQVMVLAADKNGALVRNTYAQEVQRWTGFRAFNMLTNQPGDFGGLRGLRVVDTPAVARGRDGKVQVVAIGDDGRLWHMAVSPGTRQDDFQRVLHLLASDGFPSVHRSTEHRRERPERNRRSRARHRARSLARLHEWRRLALGIDGELDHGQPQDHLCGVRSPRHLRHRRR